MEDNEILISDLIEYAKNGLGLLVNKKPSIAMLARTMDVSRPQLHRWMNGDAKPRYQSDIDKLYMLAEFWLDFETKRNIIKRKFRGRI